MAVEDIDLSVVGFFCFLLLFFFFLLFFWGGGVFCFLSFFFFILFSFFRSLHLLNVVVFQTLHIHGQSCLFSKIASLKVDVFQLQVFVKSICFWLVHFRLSGHVAQVFMIKGHHSVETRRMKF